MKKGDLLQLDITSAGMEGEGVARYDNMVVFVPQCMPGEQVKVMVREVKRKFIRASVIKVLKASPDRVQPLCPIFFKCGCCDMQHIAYAKQLQVKKENVESCLYKALGQKTDVDDVKGDGKIWGYRNKIQVPLACVSGKIVAGYYKGNSHAVVPFGERVMEDLGACVMYESGMQDILDVFLDFANRKKLTCYDETTLQGFLRHFVARKVGDSYAIVIVANGKSLPSKNELISDYQKLGIRFCLYFNENTAKTNVIMSDKLTTLYGSDAIETDVLGIKACVSPLSFMQINDGVRDMIYSAVAKEIADTPDAVVVDAYSGTGILSNVLAKSAKKVYGIEIVPDAVKDADALTALNSNSDKVQNICGDCAKVLPDVVSRCGKENTVIVVLDPPRKGCDKSVLDTLLEAKPDRICYISCNPATLARDLALLQDDYAIQRVTPYDMFPQTKHVETLVLLCRK